MNKNDSIKIIDVAVWVLLTIGGLNWGLVGIFNIDLVAAIFGGGTFLTRLVYTLVGLAAVYEVVMVKAISRRWNLHYHSPSPA